MAEAQRFAFNTSFDDLDKLAPGETVFTKAAEERGYSQGFAEGHLKGVEEGHADVLASVQNMSQKLGKLIQLHEEANENLKEEVVKTSYLMLKSIFPKYSEAFGHKEVIAIVENALKEREGDRHIKLVVSTSVEEPMRQAIEKLQKNGCEFGEVSVHSDESLVAMDCRILWENGGCEVMVSRILDEIKEAASRVISLTDIEEVPSEEDKQEESNQPIPEVEGKMETINTEDIGD